MLSTALSVFLKEVQFSSTGTHKTVDYGNQP